MTVYTFSEARQNLASVLEQAKREGAVQVKRRDGSMFTIMPVQSQGSPLDVGYVDIALTQDEIVSAVQVGRERQYTSPVQGEPPHLMWQMLLNNAGGSWHRIVRPSRPPPARHWQ